MLSVTVTSVPHGYLAVVEVNEAEGVAGLRRGVEETFGVVSGSYDLEVEGEVVGDGSDLVVAGAEIRLLASGKYLAEAELEAMGLGKDINGFCNHLDSLIGHDEDEAEEAFVNTLYLFIDAGLPDTALHEAASRCLPNAVSIIVPYASQAPDTQGDTPLTTAALSYVEAASLRKFLPDGSAALASRIQRAADVISLLMESGADTNAAMRVAKARRLPDLIELLEVAA